MKSQALIKVWDFPLRIFHWLLVAGFFAAYLLVYVKDVAALKAKRYIGHNPAGSLIIMFAP